MEHLVRTQKLSGVSKVIRMPWHNVAEIWHTCRIGSSHLLAQGLGTFVQNHGFWLHKSQFMKLWDLDKQPYGVLHCTEGGEEVNLLPYSSSISGSLLTEKGKIIHLLPPPSGSLMKSEITRQREIATVTTFHWGMANSTWSKTQFK